MSRTTKTDLREEYLQWLYPQLRDEHGNPDKQYWGLAEAMYDQPFEVVAEVDMDHNRVVDGLDLRVDFARVRRPRPSDRQLANLGPGSFLEVLIALSRRLAFVAGGEAPGWAWQLLFNLELTRMWDPLSHAKFRKAKEIMDVVIGRRYLPDGTGGFFPLQQADDDQTRIELWYQMNAYASELHPEHR